jgi:hypothetical protein
VIPDNSQGFTLVLRNGQPAYLSGSSVLNGNGMNNDPMDDATFEALKKAFPTARAVNGGI